MLDLVLGGAASGKSEYAEALAAGLLSEKERLVYLATMSAGDEESLKRISKHRAMRVGKGFITIEKSMDIEAACEAYYDTLKDSTVLLEDLSNLLANEMFGRNGDPDRVFQGIEALKRVCKNLVVVSNEIFSEDARTYDETTVEYIARLGALNCRIAQEADTVTEVVCGIPVRNE